MKKIIFVLFTLIMSISSYGFGIVNNSGSTAADSISVPFYVLDSAGNMTATTTNDSLFLAVFYPSGAVAFRDTVAHGNSLITTVTAAGYSVYNWKMAVADIDGSGKDGLYSYIVWIKDHTGAALATPHKGYFQLYQSNDFNIWATRIIDSLQSVLDSIQNKSQWTIRRTDSAAIVVDLADSSINEASIKSNSFSNAKFAGNAFDSDNFDGTVREEFWNIPFTSGAVVAGSMWDSLNNSSYVQGTASGLDSAFHSRMLARKIFGIPSGSGSDSTTLSQRKVLSWGGFVDSNRTEQGGISGANRVWDVYVYDSSGAETPIPGADVDVQLTDGTVKSRGTTDASGLVTFTVTDGDWVLVSKETGYVFEPLSKTISSNTTDTVRGYDIPIGSPSSPALCRVYGYVYSVGAESEEGANVNAYLPSGVARSGNLIISPFSVSTATDSTGYFYLDLIRSDSLVPAGTLYDFVITRKDGTIVHKRVSVPDQASWLLEW